MKYRFLFSAFIIVVCSSFLSYSSLLEENPNSKSITVIQLFTSQGCSSCPSADRLLDKVKSEYEENGVYVLSYHVDYWNRLGWNDPFSKEKFTNLQRQYGSKFRSRSVYTPQAVINGKLDFVGSNEAKMYGNIKKNLKSNAVNNLELLNLNKNGGTISLQYKVSGNLNNKDLKLALVIDSKTTQVKRGENGGRTLKNSNIVVEQVALDLSENNGKTTIKIPTIVSPDDSLRIIGFIQQDDLEITGAAQLKV
ncbi:DUF1223 domain-containing protein [Patiriisocius hiemis]|uniref:DUF1223 domain-containing protein n=1 Tax=Patiriisocius hiemis TaxID=3075604 RepID=A0ABU2Y9D1_9FLAO|nr:DUF1223 domain-containing protein [Constantimarinum sp. W242]MDT0554784.1 DUF1223 domain-containing protein [Constantimarinum sp. W242]